MPPSEPEIERTHPLFGARNNLMGAKVNVLGLQHFTWLMQYRRHVFQPETIKLRESLDPSRVSFWFLRRNENGNPEEIFGAKPSS